MSRQEDKHLKDSGAQSGPLSDTELHAHHIVNVASGGIHELSNRITWWWRDPVVTMSELVDEFGISQQALSKRLRGAHRTLVENPLTFSSATDIEPDQ